MQQFNIFIFHRHLLHTLFVYKSHKFSNLHFAQTILVEPPYNIIIFELSNWIIVRINYSPFFIQYCFIISGIILVVFFVIQQFNIFIFHRHLLYTLFVYKSHKFSNLHFAQTILVEIFNFIVFKWSYWFEFRIKYAPFIISF